MDCFGTYFTHVQTCENVRVQSATQWTASAHTLHMSKPVIARKESNRDSTPLVTVVFLKEMICVAENGLKKLRQN